MKEIVSIYNDACLGNQDALAFVIAFHGYCHQIDDLIDGDTAYNPENLLRVLMCANALYSTPFYLQNAWRLQPVIASITNTYADSVAWETSDEPWKQRVADVIRQCGNDMILAVAWIVGGWANMRAISLKLREAAYHSQHED